MDVMFKTIINYKAMIKKSFLEELDTQDTLQELLRKHERFVLENMEDFDPEVANQKTRLDKFFCWLRYGHLIKEGQNHCRRCGKELHK